MIEKIDVENLGYVTTEYRDSMPWANKYSPQEAAKILAEKLNEVINKLNEDTTSKQW